MKRKNKVLIGGFLACLGSLLTSQIIRENHIEKQHAKVIIAIRETLKQKGRVTAFYIDEENSGADFLSGGAVLDDRDCYRFSYRHQKINIMREGQI